MTTSLENSRCPIFIGGSGRCGTTILTDVLSTHPNLFTLLRNSTGSMEGRFITNADGVLPTLLSKNTNSALKTFRNRLLGDWLRDEKSGNGDPKKQRGLFHYFPDPLALEDLLIEFERGVNEATTREARFSSGSRLISKIFGQVQTRTGGRRWVEKTPTNILYVEELISMYPEGKFIHIYRDGRDVADSIIEKQFWPIWKNPKSPKINLMDFSIKNAATYWSEIIHLARRQGAVVGPNRYLEVKFEDLIGQHNETMSRICDFIEEPFDPEMLQPKQQKANLKRWETSFTEAGKKDFKKRAQPLLIELGYEKDDGW